MLLYFDSSIYQYINDTISLRQKKSSQSGKKKSLPINELTAGWRMMGSLIGNIS